MSDQVKISHSLRLLTRFEKMKENVVICDFKIKVGNELFSVHRAVLVASSDYFEGMFSSNMKEVREGYVEMKNLGVNAIEQAIEFMYTGSAKITMDSVQDILHVAELFQLDGLKNLCFQFLLDNLSPKNCLSVINLGQTYNRQDVKEKAERIVVTNLEVVILSEMFPLISSSDLLRYISNVGYETSWKAAITWAKDKEEFPQRIEGINIKKFPFKFLLETVLDEPLVEKFKPAKNLVISALFSDAENLRKNLDAGNCILLKNLGNQHGVDDAIKGIIDSFFQTNFEEISRKPDFCDISKDDVFSLFQSPDTKYSSETVKWEAAMKWVKRDIQDRKKFFPDLFSFIKLEDLPMVFLKGTVRSESMVRDSRKCTDLLLDAVFTKASKLECGFDSKEQDAVGGISQALESDCKVSADLLRTLIINEQPNGGKLTVDKTGSSYYAQKITYEFPAGQLKGISYSSQIFEAFVPEGHLLNRLTKAFHAGHVFKLEYQNGKQQGRIVWGDIPHKTNTSGGPQNNGYPDLGYKKRLYAALRFKGF